MQNTKHVFKKDKIIFQFDFEPKQKKIYSVRVAIHGTKKNAKNIQIIELTTYKIDAKNTFIERCLIRATLKNITRIEVNYITETRG